MPLTLIGLRGSGKTTVGRAVAARLDRQFIDADDEIERRAGRTIREIFAVDGEETFRRLEREVMADLLRDDHLVIAAGGGAVLADVTRALLRDSGVVVYLKISPQMAVRRMEQDATTADRRPALTALDPVAEMELILQIREPMYRDCASLILEAGDLKAGELADAIVANVNGERGQESAT